LTARRFEFFRWVVLPLSVKVQGELGSSVPEGEGLQAIELCGTAAISRRLNDGLGNALSFPPALPDPLKNQSFSTYSRYSGPPQFWTN
jgi:hypothetical protein